MSNQEQDLQEEFDQIDEQLEEQEETAVDESSPSGFLTFEEYVAKGNDPDMYRGKKAFEQFYDKNQEVKQTKAELRELKDSVEAMALAIREQSMGEAREKILAAEERMKQARDEADVDAYAKWAEEASKLKQKVQQQAVNVEQKAGEPVFIQQFRQSNPVLDVNNVEAFDPDINLLVENRFNSEIQRLAPQYQTEAEAKKILSNIYKEVTGRFASKKEPKTPIKTRQVAKNNVETTGTKLSSLTPTARSIYETVLSTSGEEAAKIYLNNIRK